MADNNATAQSAPVDLSAYTIKKTKWYSAPIKYIILIFWTVVNLFPVYWMFTFALKSNDEIFGVNVIGLPKEWLWSNFTRALNTGNMPRYFLNSLIIAVFTIVLTLIAAVMATYGLTRIAWKGRGALNKLLMLGITIPIHASVLPVYLLLIKLKMLNSYQSLIVPYAAFSLSMAILICTGFMNDIPKDLDEAAYIDGCGTWRTFIKIIAPLTKPALSTIGIYTFLQCWNELMFANIFVSDSVHRTLPVGIQALSGSYTTEWGPIGAALVLATFPTLIAYIFLSKNIQKSFIAGAIKG